MKWRSLAGFSWLLLLSACAQPMSKPESISIDQRLQKLEERVESLERLYAITPSPPLRSRAEIEERIQSLEAERTTLLEQYESAHPYVRDINLRLRLLRSQLEMLDQAQTSPK
jgi:chromosome segregation ATPase